MAWTLQLLDDTTTLDLNDNAAYSARSLLTPVPNRRTARGGVNLFRHGSDIRERVYANRTVTAVIRIHGTSQDNLIANILAVNSLLERAAEYTTTGLGSQVKLRRKWEGATNQVDFHVLTGTLALGDEFSPLRSQNTTFANAVLTLTCEPFAYGAEETIENYVLDPGFEVAGTALADWTTNHTGSGTSARDTSAKKDGNSSLKLVMTSSSSGQVIERNQVLTDVDAGEVWSFQCWVRVDALSDCKVVMELDYNTGTDVEVSTTTVNSSEFVNLTANNNTVPGSVTQVTLRLRLEATAGSATGIVYVDNVIAVLASAVPVAWASSRSITNHLADDSQATTNYIDIEDVPGDMPAELQLTVTEAQDHDEFWAGARHAGRQYDAVWLEGEANTATATISTPSSYTMVNNATESDGTHSDGSARQVSAERPGSGAADIGTTLTALFRLDYAITTLPKGSFRVLVGVKVAENSGSGNTHNAAQWAFGMGFTYGDVNLLSITAPDTGSFVELPAQTIGAGTQSNREVLDLGTVTIPPVVTATNMTDGTFTLSVFCAWDTTPSGASYNQVSAGQRVLWFVDWVLLLPNDRGSNYTTKTNDTDVILLNSMGDAKGLFLVDASDVVQSFPSTQLGRSPEVHPQGTRVYIVAKGAATSTKGDTFTLRVRYRPRFLQVMGA